jgi:hypothetical protein
VKAITSTYARFVGLAGLLFATMVFFGQVVGAFGGALSDTPWLVAALACLGLTGIGGSVLYLLSFDGTPHQRTRPRRMLGWAGMMFCASMPTGYLFLIAPLVLSGLFTMLIPPDLSLKRRGRHIATSG